MSVLPQQHDTAPPASMTDPRGAGGSVHIAIRDLQQRFERAGMVTHALDGLDLEVRAGELVAVVGPSGCGKSTMLRIVAGLLPFSSGVVQVGGRDVTGPQTDLGIVFQSPVLLDWRNVLDNVLIQLELRGLDANQYRDRAKQLLVDVGLGDFQDRRPRELSGGMRQRVAIAMALVMEPDLVLLDEPTSALDVLTQANVMNLLKRVKSEVKTSFILITHDIATSSEIADDAAVMYAGEMVEWSDAGRFYLEPLHPYSKMLMASVPTLHEDRELSFIPGQPPSLINPPTGCRFKDRCPLRFEKCDEAPPMFDTDDGRKVRCWLHG